MWPAGHALSSPGLDYLIAYASFISTTDLIHKLEEKD